MTLAERNLPDFAPRFIEVDRVSPMTFRGVDVGVVLDMMIHDIDVLLMLMGTEPEQIQANAVSVFGEAEDVCNARLTFAADADGVACVANITASLSTLEGRIAQRAPGPMAPVSEPLSDQAAQSGSRPVGGLAHSIAGAKKATGKNVLGAIAKLKQMRN